jgi:hypothetical protein
MKGRDKRRRVKARRGTSHREGAPRSVSDDIGRGTEKVAKDCGGRVCGECETCREKMRRMGVNQ